MDVKNEEQAKKQSNVVKMDTLQSKGKEPNDIVDVAVDNNKDVTVEEDDHTTYTFKHRIWVIVLIAIGTAVAVIVSVAVIVTVQTDDDDDVVTPTPPDVDVDVGEPLFLTPYVELGEFEAARIKSRVYWSDSPDTELYAGFITVNETFNSNLHFVFAPSKANVKKDPVVMYLNGGPGSSSIYCVYSCNGPVKLDKHGNLKAVKSSWNEKFSVLYLDQPVGTGYSFTEHFNGYAKGQNDIARDIYKFLIQFYKIFPYHRNPFYLTGESYAGKYIPAISYRIHKLNPTAELKINMQGMFISAGYSDPEVMVSQYADFIYYVGMFTEKERDYFRTQTEEISRLIREKKFIDAFEINDRILLGWLMPNSTYFYNKTGSSNAGDFRVTKAPDYAPGNNYMNSPEIRKSFFAGNLTLHNGTEVFRNMQNDLLTSVKPWVTELLDNDYKMMFLSGQFDLLVNVAMTEAFLMSVNWKGLPTYRTADKIVWRVRPDDEDPAGYVRQAHNLFQVVVRGAGHPVFEEQPERVFDLLQRFINDAPFS